MIADILKQFKIVSVTDNKLAELNSKKFSFLKIKIMNIKILVLIMIFPLVSINCIQDDLQNEKCDQLINEPYNFPIKPGDPEWSNFETDVERYNAVQIPESILKCLTDEALLQTCIDYPLYLDFTASSDTDPSTGFEKFLVKKFNGLQELFERKNIETILLDRYISEDMYSFVEKYYIFRLEYFFMFLSRESIISNLDENQVYNFIKNSLDKFDTIQNESPPYILRYSGVELIITYLMAKVMLYHNFLPFVNYYNSMGYINVSSVPPNKAVEYARQFIKQWS
ncbi:MAG: hypothetical protein AMS27_13345 [Bacteroides sp. SM23_62_1]|nr:MAG: hypothetical protein AMS27_13345 [Bacteroides sp. SM23_62_1]